jgi:GNAT superfamily N-acetyltransferase
MNRLAFQIRPECFPSNQGMRLMGISNGQPIAVCSVRTSEPQYACLTYLKVKKPYRRQKVATLLLQRLEKELAARGCCNVEVRVIGRHLTDGVNELLTGQGWSPPRVTGLLCVTDFISLSPARWLSFQKLPSACDVFPWLELTARDRDALQIACGRGFAEDLNPFADESLVDPVSSFGLRSDDQVVGWCIFHRVSGDDVRCAGLFVRKDFRKRGYALALAARSIHAHGQARNGRIFFDVSLKRTAMMHFFEDGLLPYVRSLSLVNTSVKNLCNAAWEVSA